MATLQKIIRYGIILRFAKKVLRRYLYVPWRCVSALYGLGISDLEILARDMHLSNYR